MEGAEKSIRAYNYNPGDGWLPECTVKLAFRDIPACGVFVQAGQSQAKARSTWRWTLPGSELSELTTTEGLFAPALLIILGPKTSL